MRVRPIDYLLENWPALARLRMNPHLHPLLARGGEKSYVCSCVYDFTVWRSAL
jgi:hypothetical protein